MYGKISNCLFVHDEYIYTDVAAFSQGYNQMLHLHRITLMAYYIF